MTSEISTENAVDGLKLKASAAADLEVISTHLQDALCKVGDLAFIAPRRRFAGVCNRFQWERAEGPPMRVRTGFHFDGVLAARARRVRLGASDAVLSLLAVTFEPGEDEAGVVELAFSGGGAIRLDVECLDAHMTDLSAPWPARRRPRHRLT